jgi:Asp-tRNA(Asn)/Glu-tRNA(Gln) amidotransferase A subunit family amidase
MGKSRREFLAEGTMGIVGVAMASGGERAVAGQTPQTPSTPSNPGAPPVFGTAPPVGPAVSVETFSEAEKLVQVEMTAAHKAQAAGNWQQAMAPVYERRQGPHKIELTERDVPATLWNPAIPDIVVNVGRDIFVPTGGKDIPVPANDDDIAFAPITQLSSWIQDQKLTSERLTHIYLARLERFDPELKCVITLLRDRAMAQAKALDAELASGGYRGPLHGIPWGAKDLLDTKGIPTTYGAEPFRDRIPTHDAAVVKKLNEAGAVLVAKLSMGALALNDIWFGGQTKNPWLPEEGSSGSSAGPGAAVGAGLVGFAIGSETQGSIISPSMRCGVTGLRPTFGRVARTGAMTLSWTCDKLGPMARSVNDTMLVLDAIDGPDAGDLVSVQQPLDYNVKQSMQGLRVGYFPAWMNEPPATQVDRDALVMMQKLGWKPTPLELPPGPYDSLNLILFAESAAAFEEITLNHKVDELKMQVSDAWPNTFRQSRFLSAVDFVQADRLRRKVAVLMAHIMNRVDVLLVPSLRDEMLVISNFTGNPSLTLRAGFVEVSEARSDWAPDPLRPLAKFSPPRRVPYGITLIGKLFEEGILGQAGVALEQAFGVASERPKGF